MIFESPQSRGQLWADAKDVDEQTLPLHFECLAAVSTSRYG